MSDAKPFPDRRASAARIHKFIKRSTLNSKTNDCWLWIGSTDTVGYGQAVIDKRRYMIHRVFYEFFVGEIPEGQEIDHLCRKRNCVNPFHMEVVDRNVNMQRAIGVGQYDRSHLMTERSANKKKCRNGHLLTDDNVYYGPNRSRTCRTCALKRAAEEREKRRVAEAASKRSPLPSQSIGRP